MGAAKTIVVAAYSGWAKASDNPAAQVLRSVIELETPGFSLVALEIPVLTDTLYRTVDAALAEHRPDIWLGIGLAPGASSIRAEMVATNWRDFEVPDEAGICAKALPIIEDAPPAYNATMPNRRIVEAITSVGIPAMLSYAAGNHLCNQMLYTVRHLSEARGLNVMSGFVHIPFTTEHVVRYCLPDDPQPSMTLEMMTEAARITVRELLDAAGERT